ncbi:MULTISPECIES: SpoIIE family protein phosphatase [unclassified Streptomyces]|uniref:SpoIIE family protein phosphatase n=1 Tax=unclassified Streptomyces TaxID=2593676 RepID=UPI002DDA1B6C|nr:MULTISPECIES: SpoIIE family protein phosphatase [unclassified Streptomyces]WSC40593.1 serine/threonine-protein phosphatase [Streptomyces sp. NBC_01763]WSC52300.1 serine/threonine-protein phosphatase [Streptomyces sp. NBC_01761]WSF83148.1 serine/threonine-protein phosphatase [Streptomyces sp. NBC_01744]WSJ49614.1 serine/threonine-protein phosphatase [Streptomyces sp. NBC_01318]
MDPRRCLDGHGTARVLEPSEEGPSLGMIMLKDRAFPIDSLSLPPGSTLLCYTDGTTESRDATGTLYGAAARAGWGFRQGFSSPIPRGRPVRRWHGGRIRV